MLHPDKLVGVARAVQQRPRRPKPSAEKAAIGAASSPKPLSPAGKTEAGQGDLMANLAYRMRDAHWNGFLDRMGRGGVSDPAGKPAQTQSNKPKAAPSITISLGPPTNA